MNNSSNKNQCKIYYWSGRSKAIAINGGNPDLANHLFHLLLSELPGRKKSLNRAFLEKDRDGMKKNAHKIKSGVMYCAIDSIIYNIDILYDALENNASMGSIGHSLDLVNLSIDKVLKDL